MPVMRKFTDEELRLAPLVAEVMDPEGPRIESCPPDMLSNYIRANLLEHDCLEWLRGRGWWYQMQNQQYNPDKHGVGIWDDPEDEPLVPIEECDTLLLALYRVIIAVKGTNSSENPNSSTYKEEG